MKEETKCYCGHTTTCDCGPETLEETAERLYPTDYGVKSKDILCIIKQDAFINGAKFVQQGRSYSEDDMIEFGKFMLLKNHEYKSYQNIFNEWVKQFKNK